MRLVWQLVAVAAVAFLGGQGLAAVEGNPWLEFGIGCATAVLAVLVYGWVVARTERRTVTEVGRDGALAPLVWGTLGGLALFGMVVTNLGVNGYYEVDGIGSRAGALGLFGFMAAAAVTEEVMWRGVLFRIVEEHLGTWLALLLSGVLFGLSHLLNPNANVWGALAVAIEAGGMLTAAYIATRRLWVPIGLHFGWNFAGGGIFSTEVSGNDTAQGLLDSTTDGPAVFTGGDFGPEGSVWALLFCVLTTVGFLWVANRRGHIRPRRTRADRAAAAHQSAGTTGAGTTTGGTTAGGATTAGTTATGTTAGGATTASEEAGETPGPESAGQPAGEAARTTLPR